MERPAELGVQQSPVLTPLAQFATKALIIAAVCLGSIWILLNDLDDFIDRQLHRFQTTMEADTKVDGHKLWSKLQMEIEKEADTKNDFTPEERQRLLSDIGIIARRWRPFVLEAISVAAPNQSDKPEK